MSKTKKIRSEQSDGKTATLRETEKKSQSAQKNSQATLRAQKKSENTEKVSVRSKSSDRSVLQTTHPKEVQKPKTDTDDNTHIVISESQNPRAAWYVVHTYSGHEKRVAQALTQRVQTMNLTDKVLEILIPTQNKIKIVKGKKQEIAEKIFPGYMLVKMILDDNSWLAVRTTQGVTGFVGSGKKPVPLPAREVETIIKFTRLAAPKYKASFSTGEAVKIIDGPFTDFLGTVDSLDEEKGKIKVLVSIFGRETPVELDFLQISKI